LKRQVAELKTMMHKLKEKKAEEPVYAVLTSCCRVENNDA